ncbi:signal peptide peptidase SppA [Flavobacterium gawalongense]|uniref:Signal peptide peptidase SppA n=1 Tax=Flavobacterium gawalongense TaxID=2594432 RepID=A0A553BXK3_9FLAO|nr:signal peptide peptidase SppA [Flavobacterium gawalongense]TRX04277.1 signal peptide peptidase SppA [Flavobacterium gawalongense]TRX09274.1 signal peptide peptidase SppA [Flavobacterium gawalongense]TRX12913.1 signal peptide peptidase SppA [Flavobacterium gawalongense]TRX13257.1 signal peptide peptidase SppA [Flavobacterium gawalongense]TRX30681.1 signal peptide peptidase SppA [Flavobacterium gawalongense]
MKFLGNVLATIIGIFIFFMLFFFGILIIGAIFGGESEGVTVKNNSVIELDLENIKNDYAGKYKDPWMELFSDGKNIGLSDIINAIEEAKTDDDIKGISILNTDSSLGMAQSKALRDALESFKKSGKFVMAYANSYSQKEYYLNSVANPIYLNPVGEMDFKGLSSEIMFFKDFQEKSGVKMEVIRHGKYKSAVEPFLENKMSDANREQISALLNAVWNSVTTDISKSRNVSIAKLNEIANGLLARTPEMAKKQGLVDIVAYEDVYHNAIKNLLKVAKDEDYNKVTILDYAKKVATTSKITDANDKIAIIYAQGEIHSGEGDVNVIGEGSMRRSLQEARKDKNVKAIVLRINSPGGNALTSDLIWREIELTKKVKPVVVSMGNYAASGGYYIACNANKIFAENNTITGSIGVFGILPNFSQLIKKIGINVEQVKTHENAAKYSPFVPLDQKLKAVTLEEVEKIYKTFVTHVAEGRKMTFAQVDAIAQGRVWAGSEALKIGLVDKIGGLDDAIHEAAALAKTKTYSTQNYPEYEKDFNDVLARLPFAKSKETFIKEEIGAENYKIMEGIKRLQAQTGTQTMMPFEINIH